MLDINCVDQVGKLGFGGKYQAAGRSSAQLSNGIADWQGRHPIWVIVANASDGAFPLS